MTDLVSPKDWFMAAGRSLPYAIGLAALIPIGQCWAGIAYVSVGTSFGQEVGESGDAQEPNTTGDVALNIEVSDSSENGATASASARVRFSSFVAASRPKLGAKAQGAKGTSPEGDPVPAGGAALAGWFDHVTYENPLAVDPAVVAALKLSITLNVSGTVANGNFADVSLFLSWPNPNPSQPPTVLNSTMSYAGPIRVSRELMTLEGPASALLGSGADFAMQLEVAGGTDQQFKAGVTDFSHTAELKHFLLADAGGLHVPGSENLQIIGEGGIRYPTYTPLTLPPEESADFDDDGDVDGADFLNWQRGVGTTSDAEREDGDADGDRAVTDADLSVWQEQYAQAASAAAIPEPATATMGLIGIAIATSLRRCA